MKIYADTAVVEEIRSVYNYVSGITTNPTLMRKAGVVNYLDHASALSRGFPEKSLSLEVIADDPEEMIAQGRKLAKIGDNVTVKIPIVNSRGESCEQAIMQLTTERIRVNVTAVFTYEQFRAAKSSLNWGYNDGNIISVFAGRIADTGVDPVAMIRNMASTLGDASRISVLWASTREILNYAHAECATCGIITMTPNLIHKMIALRFKDLTELSTETAKMFYDDAKKSGYTI